MYLLKYAEYPFGLDAQGTPKWCLAQNNQDLNPDYERFLQDYPHPKASFEDLFCKMIA